MVKNMVRVLGTCYIICMCVCVGASDMKIASDDPFSMPPPWLHAMFGTGR
jgi:hypothetical protein